MEPRVEGNRIVELLLSEMRLVGCYVIGFIGACSVVTFYWGPWGWIILAAGSVIALPFLGFSVVVLAIFYGSIRDHLTIWCLSWPIVILIIWLCYEYRSTYKDRFSSVEYIGLQNVIERGALVVVTASISAYAFYRLERARSGPRDL